MRKKLCHLYLCLIGTFKILPKPLNDEIIQCQKLVGEPHNINENAN